MKSKTRHGNRANNKSKKFSSARKQNNTNDDRRTAQKNAKHTVPHYTSDIYDYYDA